MAVSPNIAGGSKQRDAFFSRVIQQHARLLYRVAFSVLRNPADAEDAVGDALLKLLRTGAWDGVQSNERAFLTRTVWRCALDHLARRSPGEKEDAELALLVDGQPSPEERSMALEQANVMDELIDALAVELREPLVLSAVHELNSREIGEVMHLPEGTVRTRLMRARAVLREAYERYLQSRRDHEVAAGGPGR